MSSNALEIYKKAVDLANKLDDSFLELGEVLRQAQKDDPKLFEKLLKAPGLGKRRGYYLLEIARAFEGLPIDKSLLTSIGWTKLAIIARFVSTDPAHLLTLARTHTVPQLRQIMRGEVPNMDPRIVMFYFTKEEYELFAAALLKFGAKRTKRGLSYHRRALFNMIKQVCG